jgi:hypothetical protein
LQLDRNDENEHEVSDSNEEFSDSDDSDDESDETDESDESEEEDEEGADEDEEEGEDSVVVSGETLNIRIHQLHEKFYYPAIDMWQHQSIGYVLDFHGLLWSLCKTVTDWMLEQQKRWPQSSLLAYQLYTVSKWKEDMMHEIEVSISPLPYLVNHLDMPFELSQDMKRSVAIYETRAVNLLTQAQTKILERLHLIRIKGRNIYQPIFDAMTKAYQRMKQNVILGNCPGFKALTKTWHCVYIRGHSFVQKMKPLTYVLCDCLPNSYHYDFALFRGNPSSIEAPYHFRELLTALETKHHFPIVADMHHWAEKGFVMACSMANHFDDADPRHKCVRWLYGRTLELHQLHINISQYYLGSEKVYGREIKRLHRALQYNEELTNKIVASLDYDSTCNSAEDRIVEHMYLQPVAAFSLTSNMDEHAYSIDNLKAGFVEIVQNVSTIKYFPTSSNQKQTMEWKKALTTLEEILDMAENVSNHNILVRRMIADTYICLAQLGSKKVAVEMKDRVMQWETLLTNCCGWTMYPLPSLSSIVTLNMLFQHTKMLLTMQLMEQDRYIPGQKELLFEMFANGFQKWYAIYSKRPVVPNRRLCITMISAVTLANYFLFWMLKYLEMKRMQYEEQKAMTRFLQKYNLSVSLPNLQSYFDSLETMLNSKVTFSSTLLDISAIFLEASEESGEGLLRPLRELEMNNERHSWIQSMQVSSKTEKAVNKMFKQVAINCKKEWMKLIGAAICFK